MSLLFREMGWKHDLPSPNTPANSDPEIASLNLPPAKFNDILLELDRPNIKLRGARSIAGTLLLLLLIDTIAFITINSINSKFSISHLDILSGTALSILILFSAAPLLRFDFQQPCNEPIRVNRHRRKIYVYRYKSDFLHPFSKKNWGVHPAIYDWNDLIAEAYSIYLPMGYGGLKESVKIAVRKPGTEEVIDRFVLSDNIHEGTQYWNLIRLFMQQGPEALPFFKYQPLDWDHERSLTLFRRRAPKVQWPPEMDLESRTAPTPGAPQ